MKRYSANWIGTTLVVVVGLGIWISGNYLNIREELVSGNQFPNLEIFSALFISATILFLILYSYAEIDGNKLKYVWLFFKRRTIDINSITHINDQPTHKIAKSQFRSLYIFAQNEKAEKEWLEFRITIFPEKELARLVRDLKALNPRIELNNYTEKLMRSVS